MPGEACHGIRGIYIPFNVPSSKNGKVSYTPGIVINSPATQRWRRVTKPYWIKYKEEFLNSIKDLPKPHYLLLTFIRQSKHKFDYINPAQTVQDEMKTYGWIEDDNCDEIKPFFGDYIYDKVNPGVYIEILTDKNKINDLLCYSRTDTAVSTVTGA